MILAEPIVVYLVPYDAAGLEQGLAEALKPLALILSRDALPNFIEKRSCPIYLQVPIWLICPAYPHRDRAERCGHYTGENFRGRSCPKPLPVMVMHSKNDKLFPGVDKQTIGWWSACNGCADAPETGCIAYAGCENGGATGYCEGEGPHPVGPGNNKAVQIF